MHSDRKANKKQAEANEAAIKADASRQRKGLFRRSSAVTPVPATSPTATTVTRSGSLFSKSQSGVAINDSQALIDARAHLDAAYKAERDLEVALKNAKVCALYYDGKLASADCCVSGSKQITARNAKLKVEELQREAAIECVPCSL